MDVEKLILDVEGLIKETEQDIRVARALIDMYTDPDEKQHYANQVRQFEDKLEKNKQWLSEMKAWV